MTKITILIHDPRWKGYAPLVRKAARAALKHEGQAGAITIVLGNDAEIRELNHQYRSKDKPTNVLSFPNGGEEDGVLMLGDIILAYETITREAVEQKKTFEHHTAHLVVHGVLHLLGHDHEDDSEAEAMETQEIRILARMAIDNPYEAQ